MHLLQSSVISLALSIPILPVPYLEIGHATLLWSLVAVGAIAALALPYLLSQFSTTNKAVFRQFVEDVLNQGDLTAAETIIPG